MSPPSHLRCCGETEKRLGFAETFLGMWRSLVAHLTGGQGVAGSNPVIPTSFQNLPLATRLQRQQKQGLTSEGWAFFRGHGTDVERDSRCQMMAETGNALIVIDTTQYLELYRLSNGPKLLNAIKEQQKHIFITKQVVNEVQRNKLREAAKLRAALFEELTQAERCSTISEAIRQKIQGTAAKFKTDTPEILDRVSRSEDDVSKSLADLFKGAVRESTDELQRARLRKERGNPPGKREDPLGDQLTWEQLLSHAKGKSRLWIISADRDYYLAQNGRRFLNAFLYEELAAVNTPPTQVFCFDDLLKGLKDFAQQTGATADALPTEDESQKIEEEMLRVRDEVAANLIPVGWLTSNASAMDAADAVMQQYAARQRNAAAYTMTVQGIFPGLLPDKTHEEND